MADNSMLIKVGLIGAAGYVAYRQGWLSMLGIGAPAVFASTATSGVPVTVATPTGPNSLDAIYARMVAAAGSGLYSVDEWNWYLMNVQPSITAPDPNEVFPAGFDRSAKITALAYWGAMAPYLKAKMGLSGLGLRGLGCIADLACGAPEDLACMCGGNW